MTEEQFWGLVDFIDWPTRHGQFVHVQKLLMSRIKREESDSVRSMLQAKMDALDAALARTPGVREMGVSMDDHLDLLAEVVSEGRLAYQAALEDPARIVDKWRAGDVHYSFYMLLPFEHDYDKLDGGYYAARADAIRDSARGVLEGEDFSPAHDLARELIDLLQPLVARNLTVFMALEDRTRRVAADLHEVYRGLLVDWAEAHQMLAAPKTEIGSQVQRLYRDAHTWLPTPREFRNNSSSQ